MKSRNPMVGRHAAGTPIGKNGTKPPSRTGSASGNFVGGGVNQKTAQKPEYSRVKPASAANYTQQAEQFTKSAPEPFRNPQPSQNPNPLPPQQSGGPNKAYQPFKGSRVSVSDGNNPSTAAGVKNSSDKRTNFVGGNSGAVGITGSRGRGSENGKVAGVSQPRKSGSPFNQGKATKPSFYGR